jgi:hypothetical protein
MERDVGEDASGGGGGPVGCGLVAPFFLVSPSAAGGSINPQRRRLNGAPISLPRWRKRCADLLVGRMGLDHILSSPSPTPPPAPAPASTSVMGEGCHFAVRFSRDGARVAAAAAECVEIWDCSGGGPPPRRRHRLEGHSEIVTNLVWSHRHGDGDGGGTEVGDFFTCSLDKTIKLWRDCRVVHSFDDHKGATLACIHTHTHTHTHHRTRTRMHECLTCEARSINHQQTAQLGARDGRRDDAIGLRVVDHLRMGRGHRPSPLHPPRRPLLPSISLPHCRSARMTCN